MTEFKRILVPLDGSLLAEKALPSAMKLARQFASEIILLRVLDGIHVPMVSTFSQYASSWLAEAREHACQEAKNYLQAQQAELRQQGFEVRILLRENSPAEEIINVAIAENVDIIVMSTHGLGGLARWTVGSVADKVARHSLCPVLLVRHASRPETTKESQQSSES